MKLEPQIEKLYQTLDRELDNFPSGTKFFSTRKLMDKFNATAACWMRCSTGSRRTG